MYTVYALYSSSFEKIYVGYSSDLKGRLISHNEIGKKGWTMKYRPWALLHKEEFLEKRDAIKREKGLKTAKGRQFIWSLVKKAKN